MIDLHCHILPRVDDGAQSLKESIFMAKKAVANGITHIVATPHHRNGRYYNEKKQIIKQVQLLQQELEKKNIPLLLSCGQEIRINGKLMTDIMEGKIQFLDPRQQYLLIEFPTTFIPAYSEELLLKLRENGHIPIIVHPERNQVFASQPNKLLQFIENGALSQLTAGSYLGEWGRKTKKVSQQLIEANLVHIFASDAHNTQSRGFCLNQAYQKLEKDYGKVKVRMYLQATQKIMAGKQITIEKPKEVKKRILFW